MVTPEQRQDVRGSLFTGIPVEPKTIWNLTDELDRKDLEIYKLVDTVEVLRSEIKHLQKELQRFVYSSTWWAEQAGNYRKEFEEIKQAFDSDCTDLQVVRKMLKIAKKALYPLACHTCDGVGRFDDVICPRCEGSGKFQKENKTLLAKCKKDTYLLDDLGSPSFRQGEQYEFYQTPYAFIVRDRYGKGTETLIKDFYERFTIINGE